VREHTRPVTPTAAGGASLRDFYRELHVADLYEVAVGQDAQGPWQEIDPNFRVYRVLPPESVIPTISGTFGRGGLSVETESEREEVKTYLALLAAKAEEKEEEEEAEEKGEGENLLLLGHAAIAERAELIARSANPIAVEAHAFEFEGKRYDEPGQAVLHSLPHPDRPGRFVTLFHGNGDAGWSRLRLIRYYARDSTVVWDGDAVVARGLFEPSRKIRDGGEGKR
jgi:hypothetical protein